MVIHQHKRGLVKKIDPCCVFRHVKLFDRFDLHIASGKGTIDATLSHFDHVMLSVSLSFFILWEPTLRHNSPQLAETQVSDALQNTFRCPGQRVAELSVRNLSVNTKIRPPSLPPHRLQSCRYYSFVLRKVHPAGSSMPMPNETSKTILDSTFRFVSRHSFRSHDSRMGVHH